MRLVQVLLLNLFVLMVPVTTYAQAASPTQAQQPVQGRRAQHLPRMRQKRNRHGNGPAAAPHGDQFRNYLAVSAVNSVEYAESQNHRRVRSAGRQIKIDHDHQFLNFM